MQNQTLNPIQQQKNQQTQNRVETQRIAQLVRAGLMKTSELPALKVAMARHAKVGDIGKLPRSQRDVLNKYYQSTSDAALKSQQSMAAVRRNIQNGYEVSRDDYISESTVKDPPMMLVLKRQGVRIFPDGKRVALYNNDKLGLSFTIPYTGNGPEQEIASVSEETETLSETIDQIAAYAQQQSPKATTKNIKFAGGSTLKVDHGTAKAIHMVHGALNSQNQKKFAEMLQDPKGFTKASHFALSKVNFSIGGK